MLRPVFYQFTGYDTNMGKLNNF